MWLVEIVLAELKVLPLLNKIEFVKALASVSARADMLSMHNTRQATIAIFTASASTSIHSGLFFSSV
jgi:hypothetical protein